MKIQCILKRVGGSHIELGGTNYHFAPQADGRHIADVTDEAHISRLLSIPEAYRVVADEALKPAAAPIPAPTGTITFTTGNGLDDPGHNHVGIDPAMGLSQGNAGWTPPPEGSSVVHTPAQSGIGVQGEGEPESDDGEAVEDKSELRTLLAAQYKERFGRLPHGKWNADKINEELQKSVA